MVSTRVVLLMVGTCLLGAGFVQIGVATLRGGVVRLGVAYVLFGVALLRWCAGVVLRVR